jgi:hypothetical protein
MQAGYESAQPQSINIHSSGQICAVMPEIKDAPHNVRSKTDAVRLGIFTKAVYSLLMGRFSVTVSEQEKSFL